MFVISYARSRSILAPAPLWNFCWCMLFVVGAVLGGGYFIDTSSTVFLFLLAASFNLFPLLATTSSVPLGAGSERAQLMQRAVRSPGWLLLATAVVGLAGAFDLSAELGHSIFSLDSIAEIFDAGKENAAELYQGTVTRSAGQTLSYATVQFGAAAVGARIRIQTDRWSWLLLAVNAMSAMSWSVVTTQRSYFLVPLLWFVAGYVAAAVATGNERISGKAIGWAVLTAGVVVAFVVFARAIRVAGANSAFDMSVVAQGKHWAACYIPTFAQWHSDGGGSVIYPLRLFSGVLSFIGLDVEDGVTADGETFTYIGNGLTSNAATMMRAVVLTGGTFGAFLIVILLGALSQIVYANARCGRTWAVAIYTGVVAMIIWSVNAWQFSYGNRVLAQVLILVALFSSVWLARRRQRPAVGGGRLVGHRGDIGVGPSRAITTAG